MFAHAVEAEVDVFLGRDCYEPSGADTDYRNGYGRPREIGIGDRSGDGSPTPGVGPAGRSRAIRVGPPAAPALSKPRDPGPLRAALSRGLLARATSSPRSGSSWARRHRCRPRRSCA